MALRFAERFSTGLLLLLVLLPATGRAGERGWRAPERMGAGVTLGHSYDPDPTFGFVQINGLLQYDYDKLWPHRTPEPLYFKMEASLGAADFKSETRLMSSVNILAQYYLADVTARLRPYGEAGIGLIYTDFQVDDQGLRLNFNPQAGIGCDLRSHSGVVWYANFRIHHLSNGGLHHANRGINSVLIQFGRYF